ncbi:MAG: ADP-ribosylation factor-like protein [Promethearchaeota archaeon]
MPEEFREVGIAVVGPYKAGKTSIVNRITFGEFLPTTPTTGFNLKEVRGKSVLFRIFDLPGQSNLARMLWESRVRISRGLIFVIDGYSCKHQEMYLHEAREWYWRVVEWAPRAAQLFLINKSDKECISSSELIEAFGISTETQNLNTFLISNVSAKENIGIKEAWDWFTKKIQLLIPVQLKSLHFYLTEGTELIIDLNLDPFSNIPGDLLAALVLGMNSFIEESLSSSLSAVKVGENVVVSIKENDSVLCSVVIDSHDFAPRAQKIAKEVLDFVSQEKLFEKKDKASERIQDFLRESYPYDLPKEVKNKDKSWETTIHKILTRKNSFLTQIWKLLCEKRSMRSNDIVLSLKLQEDIQARFLVNRSLHQIAEIVQENNGILQYTSSLFRGLHLAWHLLSPFEVKELKSDFILSGCRDLQEIQIIQTLREKSYTIENLAKKIGLPDGNVKEFETKLRELANHLRRSIGRLVLFAEDQEKGIMWHLTDEAKTTAG